MAFFIGALRRIVDARLRRQDHTVRRRTASDVSQDRMFVGTPVNMALWPTEETSARFKRSVLEREELGYEQHIRR